MKRALQNVAMSKDIPTWEMRKHEIFARFETDRIDVADRPLPVPAQSHSPIVHASRTQHRKSSQHAPPGLARWVQSNEGISAVSYAGLALVVAVLLDSPAPF